MYKLFSRIILGMVLPIKRGDIASANCIKHVTIDFFLFYSRNILTGL